MSEELTEACPACGASVGEPCDVVVDGERMEGWLHDARILKPVVDDLLAGGEGQ